MSSDSRIQVVLGLFDAYARGADLSQFVHPDVRYHIPGRNKYSGTHQGRDQMIELWEAQKRDLGGQPYGSETLDLAESDAYVYRFARIFADHPRGFSVEFPATNVYRVHNGLIEECWAHIFDTAEFDRLWAY